MNLPATMPPERAQAFVKTVAGRIRDGAAQGIAQPAVIAAVTAEQVALARTLADPQFIHAMAIVYMQEMAALQSPVPHEEAMREVGSILKNRVADCQGFVTLLGQTEFIAAAHAQALQPAAAPQPYTLTATKIEETIRRLVQPQDVAGAEPAVHVAAGARGQQVTHQALANVFRPSGALRAPLVHALATAWPQANGAQLEQLAATWLKARHDPAHSVADGLKPDGAIYIEAMRRAELLQTQKLTAADAAQAAIATAQASSAAVVANAAPSSVIAAPVIAQGVLQTPPQHDLVMGV